MRVIPSAVRSRMMRSIRKADTGPERTVRRLLRDIGVTYRLHAAELPGSPDIAVRKHRKAIFVLPAPARGLHACEAPQRTA
jgi:DNA mismatch endonuclease, patch repair protein